MTHGRTLRVARDWVEMTGLCSDDRYLMVNPYFHMFGLKAGVLACMVSGATMLPNRCSMWNGSWSASRGSGQRASRATHSVPGDTGPSRAGPSPSVDAAGGGDRCRRHPGRAGAPDHGELPFSTVITGYGLTEAGTVTATGPGDDVETIATTVGRARPGFEMRIAGDGRPLGPEEPGEVEVRGESVMAGYLDDPEATWEALSPDGWLRTGDIGVVDGAGYLRIVGRLKDMFIVGGFNAYPAEIENALLRHPAITQAAVIGIPDDRLGEVGMAFVRGTAPSAESVTSADIMAWCRAEMANYKVPRAVAIVDQLPVNATGKVMKDELRARAGQGAPRPGR